MEKVEKLLTANLNRLLEKRGWDAKALSDASGITRSGVYKILNGERWPGPDNLDRIAKAFGVTVADLFSGDRAFASKPPTPEEALEVLAKALTGRRGKPSLSEVPPLPPGIHEADLPAGVTLDWVRDILRAAEIPRIRLLIDAAASAVKGVDISALRDKTED